MKLFVDTDPDTRLSRRVLRDMSERGLFPTHLMSRFSDVSVGPMVRHAFVSTRESQPEFIPSFGPVVVWLELVYALGSAP